MAGFQDGPKLKGRFIKRGSKVLDHVALSDFDFGEIVDTPVVNHDNLDASIIHTKYHDEQEISDAVHSPRSFDQNLLNENMARPILRPLDFTEAWRRDIKRQKDRVSKNMEDDSVYDDYDAGMSEAEREAEEMEAALEQQAAAEEAAQSGQAEAAEESTDTGEAPRSQFESVDYAGEVIKNMHSDHPVEDVMVGGEEESADPVTEQMEAAIHASQNTDQRLSFADAEQETSPAAGEPQADQDFIPTATTEDALVGQPELDAANAYKQRISAPSQESIDQMVEQARAQGYEEGFKLGEEKAALQSRGQAQQIFSNLSELFAEFGSLKKEVLSNVQQNFYELSQAIAESLLKKEFKINPQAFATIIRKAIDEAVEDDKFKILVNPETFETLKSLGVEKISDHLQSATEIEPGDFKIESNLTVVDGSVSKLVSDLLDRADLELFEDEKAS